MACKITPLAKLKAILQNEKRTCAFINSSELFSPKELTVPVTYNGKVKLIDVVFHVNQRKASYVIGFGSVCRLMYPKAPGKAVEMYTYFRAEWAGAYHEICLDDTRAIPPFLEHATKFLQTSQYAEKFNARTVFAERVDDFLTEVEPQLQDFFEYPIRLAELKQFDEVIAILDEEDKKLFSRIQDACNGKKTQ